MERDPNISKLFRESGLIKAPGDLSERVMNQIQVKPDKNSYMPLIGRVGRMLVFLFITGIVVISLLFSEPGGRLPEITNWLSRLEWQIPQINFNFDFLAGFNFATWLVSTLLALFLLVLVDAGIKRKRLV